MLSAVPVTRQVTAFDSFRQVAEFWPDPLGKSLTKIPRENPFGNDLTGTTLLAGFRIKDPFGMDPPDQFPRQFPDFQDLNRRTNASRIRAAGIFDDGAAGDYWYSGLTGALPVFSASLTGFADESLTWGSAGLLPQAANVQQKAPNSKQLRIRRNIVFLSTGMSSTVKKYQAELLWFFLRSDPSQQFGEYQ